MNVEIMHTVQFITRLNPEKRLEYLKAEYKKLEEKIDLLSSLVDWEAIDATDEDSNLFFHKEFVLLLDLHTRLQKSAIWEMVLEENPTTVDDSACSKEGQ